MEVGDLVRTTTSPSSELGSIPVYEQLLGVSLGIGGPTFQVGGHVRLHDARFDTIDDDGVTVDFGLRWAPSSRLLLTAASQFFPFDVVSQDATEYYAGVEYGAASLPAPADTRAEVLGRYALTVRQTGDVEHGFGVGIDVAGHVRIDASLTRESAFDHTAWRPGVGLGLTIGRYTVVVTRSEGLNDVGAAYRLGLDISILR